MNELGFRELHNSKRYSRLFIECLADDLNLPIVCVSDIEEGFLSRDPRVIFPAYLSHWQEEVASLIKSAESIVLLNLGTGGRGLEIENTLIETLGAEARTLVCEAPTARQKVQRRATRAFRPGFSLPQRLAVAARLFENIWPEVPETYGMTDAEVFAEDRVAVRIPW